MIFDLLKKKESKGSEKRIILSEEDFINLTAGKVVEKQDVKICLSDIGLEKMSSIVAQNYYTIRYGK